MSNLKNEELKIEELKNVSGGEGEPQNTDEKAKKDLEKLYETFVRNC